VAKKSNKSDHSILDYDKFLDIINDNNQEIEKVNTSPIKEKTQKPQNFEIIIKTRKDSLSIPQNATANNNNTKKKNKLLKHKKSKFNIK
jgi:hypothetical protein